MDHLSPRQRSELMSRIRGKDTQPEWIVRRIVHALGYRYRLHVRSLPGTPDLVFSPRSKVIFVSGCFWHAHGCGWKCLPKTRTMYWAVRFARNKNRDQRVKRALQRLGWSVMTIWECQTKNTDRLRKRIAEYLEQR